jgi:hypothetical protein
MGAWSLNSRRPIIPKGGDAAWLPNTRAGYTSGLSACPPDKVVHMFFLPGIEN